MCPRFYLFCFLVSLATCAHPNNRNRVLASDGTSRSMLRASEESNLYSLFETDCSSTESTSTRSEVTVIRNSETIPIEFSLSVYTYGGVRCESNEYVVMSARTSLSPKSEGNQYTGKVLSTTFTVSGGLSSPLKCSSVVMDGIAYNVDDVRCEDASGQNPFAKMIGIVGHTHTVSLRSSEEGIHVDDELFGAIDASIMDASVGKPGPKPKPKPKPGPRPHPHPSGGGGSIGSVDVWVMLVILGVILLIVIIVAIVNGCRSDSDDEPLMDSGYYNNNQYDNGYYEGYYDGYHDGGYDGGYDGGGDDGGDGGGDDGGDFSVC